MLALNVKTKDKNYEIMIKNNLFSELPRIIIDRYQLKKIAILTDENVLNHYGEEISSLFSKERIETNLIVVKAGEENKSLAGLQQVYDNLLKFNIKRQDYLITIGGGVIGDLGGFAAATYLRGIKYIQVPTTLLAQVDSSLGGKVAIDLPQGKNLVGSFYLPQAVFIDPVFLKTLGVEFFNDGMAEVIKYGCIKDRSFFERLNSYQSKEELLKDLVEIIFICLTIKKHFVEIDEFDNGPRMILNFGHTLGHALERHFSYTKLTHGQAIALGMYHITSFSESLGISKPGTAKILKDIFSKYHLPYQISPEIIKEASKAIFLDKKSENQFINLILLKDIGQPIIKKIAPQELISFWERR